MQAAGEQLLGAVMGQGIRRQVQAAWEDWEAQQAAVWKEWMEYQEWWQRGCVAVIESVREMKAWQAESAAWQAESAAAWSEQMRAWQAESAAAWSEEACERRRKEAAAEWALEWEAMKQEFKETGRAASKEVAGRAGSE